MDKEDEIKEHPPIGVQKVNDRWYLIHDGEGGWLATGEGGIKDFNKAMRQAYLDYKNSIKWNG